MENFKNTDSLDDWLKSLKDSTDEPSSEVWESLVTRIPPKPRRKRRAIWIWLGLAALGICAFGFWNLNTAEKFDSEIVPTKTETNIKTQTQTQTISNPTKQNHQSENRPTALLEKESNPLDKDFINNKVNSVISEKSNFQNKLNFDAQTVDSNESEIEKLKSDFRKKQTNQFSKIESKEFEKLPSLKALLLYKSTPPPAFFPNKKDLRNKKGGKIFPILSVDVGYKANQFPVHNLLEIDKANVINSGNPIRTNEFGFQMNVEINPKWMVSWNIWSRRNLHFEIVNQANLVYSHSKMKTGNRGVMTGEYSHDLGVLEIRSVLNQVAGSYYPEGDEVTTEFKLIGDWVYQKSSLFVYRRFGHGKTRFALKAGIGLNSLKKSNIRVSTVRYFDNRIADAYMNIMLRDLKRKYADGTLGLDMEKPISPSLSLVLSPEINAALSPILKNHSNLGFGLFGGLRYRIR